MSTGSKKILVVEDEKPLYTALDLKLKRAGFETRICTDGHEAIKALQEEKFDLILTDLVLPKKDGFAVITETKEKQPGVPIVIISNLNQEEDIDRVKKMGITEYFVKTDVPIAHIVDYIKTLFNL
jgi:DNA-binding response OmpR family regulator